MSESSEPKPSNLESEFPEETKLLLSKETENSNKTETKSRDPGNFEVTINDFLSSDRYDDLLDLLKKESLTEHDIIHLVESYNEGKIQSREVLDILKEFDLDHSGTIHLQLNKEFHLNEGYYRYIGYATSFAKVIPRLFPKIFPKIMPKLMPKLLPKLLPKILPKILPKFASKIMPKAFQYVTHSADFGEALKPVANKQFFLGTHAITIAYCMADVGIEAYYLHKNNYIHHEKLIPMTMTQCVVERGTFQLLATLVIPGFLIHHAVHTSEKIFHRVGRFTKYGPSIVGLSVIPLLPKFVDEPVEHALDYFFRRWGPWASPDTLLAGHHHHKHHKQD